MKYKIDKTNVKIVLGCTLGCISVYFFLSLSQSYRTSNRQEAGENYLQTQVLDIAQVNENVASANQEILLANATSLEEELRIRFRDSIIVGDSIAEAFGIYHVLATSNVIAKRGMRTDNSEEDIDKAIALAPSHIFLSYGMNDLAYCRGDEECFVTQYQAILEKIQRQLPNTKIYVSAIVPMTSEARVRTPLFQAYEAYNTELKKLCEELKITFYDTSDLLLYQDAYESDGVHPKYAYYPVWLQRMVDIAGL